MGHTPESVGRYNHYQIYSFLETSITHNWVVFTNDISLAKLYLDLIFTLVTSSIFLQENFAKIYQLSNISRKRLIVNMILIGYIMDIQSYNFIKKINLFINFHHGVNENFDSYRKAHKKFQVKWGKLSDAHLSYQFFLCQN
ncbi:hypothetical protein ACJX0J_028460 [Zea mays]